MPYTYEYQRPAVTVDVVVTRRSAGGGAAEVLLVRRAHDPFRGCWALPGGFVDMDEDLPDAARRELAEETGVSVGRIEQLGAFGRPGRDPRGRTVSVVYLASAARRSARPRAGDDAAEVRWFSLSSPPRLAFDHSDILAAVRKRMRSERKKPQDRARR